MSVFTHGDDGSIIVGMKNKWYSPQLERPLVGLLYREAKARHIPMTKLANRLLRAALRDEGTIKKRRSRKALRR